MLQLTARTPGRSICADREDAPMLGSRLPVYTLQNVNTGATVQVTDPGKAMLSGKWTDIGKTKGPVLRWLAARAPYFHNGSAPDLTAVVNFYNAKFEIGLTRQQVSDLVAFLNAL